MEDAEKYFNFVRNYNEKLKEMNTTWLGPKELGEVLVQTASQNVKGGQTNGA